MTKPLGLPPSKVREPYNYHDERGVYSKRGEKKAYKHRKKTQRQIGKKQIRTEYDDR